MLLTGYLSIRIFSEVYSLKEDLAIINQYQITKLHALQ